MELTPAEEAKYALNFWVSRSDLSPEAQTEYDQLVAEGYGTPTPEPQEPGGGLRHTVSRSGDHIFRPALPARIFAGAFVVSGGVLTIVLMIAGLMNGTITGDPWALGTFPWLAAVILGMLAGIGFGVRLPFTHVRVRGQAVTIVNSCRTYRVNAAEIARITLEQKFRGGGVGDQWVPRAYLVDGRRIWLADLDCGPASGDPDPKRVLILDELKVLAGLST